MASLTLMVVSLAAISAQPKLLDFYSEHCGPCRQMAPVIDEFERRGHAVQKIDVDREPQLAAQYRVDSIPCLVVVADGREVDRVLGVTSLERLETMIRTAGTASAAAGTTDPTPTAAATPSPAVAATPSPAAPRGPIRSAMASMGGGRNRSRAPSTRGRQPLGSTGAPRLSPSDHVQPQGEPNESLSSLAAAAAAPTAPPMLTGIQSEQPLGTAVATPDFGGAPQPSAGGEDWRPSIVSGTPSPAANTAGQSATPERVLATCVRLRIEDPTGNSYGSGTIVDVRGEDALVLTCGHVFRDSQGKGGVTVDLFGPGMPQGIAGEIISYDLENDVGLVSFRPGVPVQVARIAAPGMRVQPGDPVFNAGCNNGAEATLRASRVTTVDRYVGSPNIQVAGQPVQGRSGGGLYNADGEVIGVCNAADPADNEGLYAALPSVYKLLDAANLADVYRPGAAMVAATGDQFPATDARPPHMPEQMPLAVNPVVATETSAPQGAMPLGAGPALEIVCVIRSPGDSRAKSEVIVLEDASPEFLQQLAMERERQRGKQIAPDRSMLGGSQPPTPSLEARHADPRAAVMR